MTTPRINHSLGIAEIRKQFPALARTYRGKPVAYFDGPGGTQVPQVVAHAVTDYLLHHNGNSHWEYPTSQETDAIVLAAREAFADFLNAAPNEIVFGANMTTLTFHLARALGRGWRAGDEIVVTELDHHANVAPWRALKKDRGLVVRVARMIPETGQLDWDHFAKQLSERTKLVAIGAASNALGTISDIGRAVKLAREVGAQVFVDAVHYAPHELVDVRRLDCDFLACSAYKFYGPHVGILYGRGRLLDALDFPKLEPAPNESPERVETGTPNFEGIAGAAAAVNFLASLGEGETRRAQLRSAYSTLQIHGRERCAQMWNGLSTIDRVQVYGPPPEAPRTPTVSFTITGMPATQAAQQLATRGLFLSSGDFYAATVVERLGLTNHGLVRAGCACYTTNEEVSRLLEAVRTIT